MNEKGRRGGGEEARWRSEAKRREVGPTHGAARGRAWHGTTTRAVVGGRRGCSSRACRLDPESAAHLTHCAVRVGMPLVGVA